jgi:hypothetical protein
LHRQAVALREVMSALALVIAPFAMVERAERARPPHHGRMHRYQ